MTLEVAAGGRGGARCAPEAFFLRLGGRAGLRATSGQTERVAAHESGAPAPPSLAKNGFRLGRHLMSFGSGVCSLVYIRLRAKFD